MATWKGLRIFVCIISVTALGLLIFEAELPGMPQISYKTIKLNVFKALLMDQESQELPWWDGGDCHCEGDKCHPDAVPKLSMQDVGGACGWRAWVAGGGKRVVSFSLYGNKSEYWQAFGKNLNASKTMYPGWVVWLYTDPRGREDVLCPLLSHFPHLYICDVTNLPSLGDLTSIHNMMWRTLPLGEPDVSAFVTRDSDALILEREVAAVNEWMASNKSFHVLRDHPYHGVPILGGMWGARWEVSSNRSDSGFRDSLIQLRSKMVEAAKGHFKKGFDQQLLKKVLWPAMKGDVMSHDSFFCKSFRDGFRPFPTQRESGQYVGNYMGKRKVDPLLVKRACPVQCRPPNHQNWTYC